MKWTRPTVSIQKLTEFFLDEQALAATKKDQIKKFARAALWYLDCGQLRVWDPQEQKVNIAAKRAILNYFATAAIEPFGAGCFEFQDKLRPKPRTALKGVRVSAGAVVRRGAYVEAGAILMPCFINVGACEGANTMIDTWATVGSCAQVGQGVHISGGVGLGGVLEPPTASPVIIGDGAFIGSRAVIVEGVRIGKQAVIGAGVVLTASTRIIDVTTSKPLSLKGEIPDQSVVIPGVVGKEFPAGSFDVPCALIIGKRTESTDLKTSLNAALREFNVAV